MQGIGVLKIYARLRKMNIRNVYLDLHNFEKEEKIKIYHTEYHFDVILDLIVGRVSGFSVDIENCRLSKKVGHVHINAFTYMP